RPSFLASQAQAQRRQGVHGPRGERHDAHIWYRRLPWCDIDSHELLRWVQAGLAGQEKRDLGAVWRPHPSCRVRHQLGWRRAANLPGIQVPDELTPIESGDYLTVISGE